MRPGNTTVNIAKEFPAAQEFGYTNEEEAFGLQYGHGLGLSNWEQPLTSRYHSFEHPVPIEEGMVFALETYWPTKDGTSASRIEEEVVVTADGAKVITKFPAQELLVAGSRYFTGAELAAHEARTNGVAHAGAAAL